MGPLFVIPLVIATAAQGGAPTYEQDIKPILARKCIVCHSSRKIDKIDVSGGLALDTYEAVLRGTKDHSVVAANKASESELVRRLTSTEDDRRMPQLDEPLGEAQRDIIRRWIDGGMPRGGRVETANPAMAAKRLEGRGGSLDVSIPVAPAGKTPDVMLIRIGPLPAVSALAIRPDGGLLAVGTDGRVVLWDLRDRRPAATIEVPGPVHALVFTRDGRRIVVGSGLPARSGSVRVYSVPDATLLQDFLGHTDSVYALALRKDGAQLASAGFDATVRLWNLTDGRPVGVYTGHSDFVYEVVYSPDGKTVLSASKDRSLKRFDGATLKGIRTYSDHESDVLSLALKPDGTAFVSAGEEPQLRWWKPDAEKPHRRISGHSGPVFSLAFSGDGKTLISASGDKTIRVWDGTTGALRRSLAGPTEWQYACALSFDGAIAAGSGWDGLVRVWDTESGKCRVTLAQTAAGWLSVTPSAELAASADLRPLIRWKSGGSAP
ncbi:MAG: repeat-containing protein [Planctomycetota bacterium]|nr:repeat-containing protein [Planctomycetota bacterium]